MSREDLEHRFNYHAPPDERRIAFHRAVRNTLLDAALYLDSFLPEGREKALAMTKLEEAMFWANSAIARGAADLPLPDAPAAEPGS